MIVSFEAFLPRVLLDVPACPDVSAVIAIRDAAIAFCEGSLYWRVSLDAVNVTAGESVYDLEVPVMNTSVLQVMSAELDGEKLLPRAPDWLDSNVLDWRTERQKPGYYFCENPGQVTLAGLPVGPYLLTATVALCPKRTATGIEQFIYERQLETIASGAKARLMEIPGKAWSNPNLAAYHAKKFDAGIASASGAAAKGFTRAPLRSTLHIR